MAPRAEEESREDLVREIITLEETEKEWLREQILTYNRVDLLCTEVLGYQLKPFHRKMQRHVLRNRETLTLVFRGAGKTTVLTVALIIFFVLKNPNVRILIASKTHTFAKGILSEIKSHFEMNPRLIELFGPFKSDKWEWGKERLSIAKRTRIGKEPTINTIGVESQSVGWHYDIIFGDDLVDDQNARTPIMRERTHTFYYKHLLPTLEPDENPDIQVHVIGTRYHPQDLYTHLEENEMCKTTTVIPVVNEDGKTPWPEKFSPKEMRKRRRSMGGAIWGTQMLCSKQALKGEHYDIDDMPICLPSEVPTGLPVYIGVDPSSGEGKDYFALVAIAVAAPYYWVLESWQGKLKWSNQAKKVASWARRFDAVMVGVESNGYQVVLKSEMETNYPDIPIIKVHQKEDKTVRSIRMAARHEAKYAKFCPGNEALTSTLIAMPNPDFDDLFDAYDNAVAACKELRRKKERRRRSRRRSGSGEPRKRVGVIGG